MSNNIILQPTKDVCMQIRSHAQTVLGLAAYGSQKYFNSFLPFTLSYRLPEPSIEPAQGRFHPAFLAEMRFPPLPP